MNSDNPLKRSPFFYVGDKYKLIKEIREFFPEQIDNFVEPFLGGGSVFLNVNAKRYLLNDIDQNVIALHKYLISQAKSENAFFKKVRAVVEKYNLSRSVFEDVVPSSLKKKWKKTYYAHFNREGYNSLKADFNSAKKKDPLTLYLLLIYGFNRMLRFNGQGLFNLPVGNVDFNLNVKNALSTYFATVKEREIILSSADFRTFVSSLKLGKKDFVYVDPPYLISASEYNKLWSEKEDGELMDMLDTLTKRGIKFALSNITAYNGRRNERLIAWSKKYTVHPIKSNYISYHDNSKKQITEVLITNY